MVGEHRRQIAARIAQKLRGANVGCEIVQLLPTDAAVLRRDRITTGLALTLLTALAWSYLVWLSADMGMGGTEQILALFSIHSSLIGSALWCTRPGPALVRSAGCGFGDSEHRRLRASYAPRG